MFYKAGQINVLYRSKSSRVVILKFMYKQTAFFSTYWKLSAIYNLDHNVVRML